MAGPVILITNDDGIKADGIIRLTRAAKNFGEVWVVAPDSQRSAASHSITLHSTIDVFPHSFPVDGVHAFSCTGTPGDCVRVGSLFVMPVKPDVVLSGINYGYNVAADIQYSATAGAAFEASFQGSLGVALSEQACENHDVTDIFLPEILKRVLTQKADPDYIINVNFPGCHISECRGILENRTVSKSMVFQDHYDEVGRLQGGGSRLLVRGVYREEAEEGTDFRAVTDGFISVGMVKNVG